jgi:hypothetical protein
MDQNCRDRLVEWREREEKMSQVIREAWFYTGPMEAALGICKAPATRVDACRAQPRDLTLLHIGPWRSCSDAVAMGWQKLNTKAPIVTSYPPSDARRSPSLLCSQLGLSSLLSTVLQDAKQPISSQSRCLVPRHSPSRTNATKTVALFELTVDSPLTGGATACPHAQANLAPQAGARTRDLA